MLIDGLIYGLIVSGVATLLNASAFKLKPASGIAAWTLTILMFFVNMVALTMLEVLRYQAISDSIGMPISPKSPLNMGGAFLFAWLFFSLLNRQKKNKQSAPVIDSVAPIYSPALSVSVASVATDFPNTVPSENHNTSLIQTVLDDERIYATIAKEFESGIADKGLWTRLFVECEGDERRTKVLYIRQRAERLLAVEKLRLEREAREHVDEAAKLEPIRTNSMSLIELLRVRNFTKELLNRLEDLSMTHAAVMMLNSVAQNNLQEVRDLISDEPLLVAVKNSKGNTPLHIAVREENLEMARFLLENGAITEVNNNDYWTPLQYAIYSRQDEMVSLLAANSK
jgi:hypothetical protein